MRPVSSPAWHSSFRKCPPPSEPVLNHFPLDAEHKAVQALRIVPLASVAVCCSNPLFKSGRDVEPRSYQITTIPSVAPCMMNLSWM